MSDQINVTSAPSSIDRDLGRVEGKIDGMAVSIAGIAAGLIERDKATDMRFVGVDDRIDRVEQRQYWMTGAAAAVVFIITRIDFTKVIAVMTSAH